MRPSGCPSTSWSMESTRPRSVTAPAAEVPRKPTPEGAALDPFRKLASQERATARKVLPEVEAVIAIVGVTASACGGAANSGRK